MVGRADRQRDVPEERVDLLVEEHEGVAPHYQTAPDHTIMNNYSTYPNINPNTGQQGRIRPCTGVRPSIRTRTRGTFLGS